MNERQFGAKVREALEASASRLNPGTEQRLKAARLRALERQRIELSAVAAVGDAIIARISERAGLWRLVLPFAILLAGIAGVYGWQQSQRVSEIEEIDAQLLTDELPIDAYLDRGFQRWLKQSGQE